VPFDRGEQRPQIPPVGVGATALIESLDQWMQLLVIVTRGQWSNGVDFSNRCSLETASTIRRLNECLERR
jgi:hypothetical protein